MLKAEIIPMNELEEQEIELDRMHEIKKLPSLDRRWLNKSGHLAKMLRYWLKHDTIMCSPQAAIEASFVLPYHRGNKRYEELFLPRIEEERCWVEKSLEKGDSVFRRSRLKAAGEEVVYNPIEITKGLALALDDTLFNKISPNIFVLAEINAYQQARNMWPAALGQKVQYVLEKRLAKRMMPVKGLVSPRDAAGYIQDRWLTPVVGHDRFTDADAIEIKTVCAAAYHAGIPLDQGYLWEIENKAQKEHNLKLAQQINQQAKLHKKLHCAQTAGFWISVRRCFGLDREIN